MKVLKWIGIVIGGLAGLLVLAAAALYLVGGVKANKKYETPADSLIIPTDAAAVQRGQHLADIFLCTRCHMDNLGGDLYFDVPGLVTIPTPNLTRGVGGVGSVYTDEDWVRAIRHGVGRDGRALYIMMSTSFQALSADDISAIIAYVKSVPAVDSQFPDRQFAPMGRILLAVGMFPKPAAELIDHSLPLPAAPTPGATVEYGKYLAHPCTECHGPLLNGMPFGPPGEEVPSPNLTPGGELTGWTEQDFFSTIRTGSTPSGHALSEDMPWKNYARMSDEELEAVWLYLRSLPALEQGGL